MFFDLFTGDYLAIIFLNPIAHNNADNVFYSYTKSYNAM